jgi:hypothetical protein
MQRETTNTEVRTTTTAWTKNSVYIHNMYAKQNYNLLHFTASEVSNIDFTIFYLLQQEDIPYSERKRKD